MRTKVIKNTHALTALREARELNRADLTWLQAIRDQAKDSVEAVTVAENHLAARPCDATVAAYVRAHKERALSDTAFCGAARLARPEIVLGMVQRTREPLLAAWKEIKSQLAERLEVEEAAEAVRYEEFGVLEGSVSPIVQALRADLRHAELALERLAGLDAKLPEDRLQLVSTLTNEALGD